MTAPTMAVCFCKSIVAFAETAAKRMQDMGVLISHLASFLIVFASELINKVH